MLVWKKRFFVLTVLSIAALPLVAVACGEDATTTTSYLDAGLSTLKAEPTSNAASVRWEGLPSFDTNLLTELGYGAPEYSTNAFTNVNAAAYDTTTTWTKTLPTYFDPSPESRALWARFPSLDLNQQPNFAINLTFNVGIKALR